MGLVHPVPEPHAHVDLAAFAANGQHRRLVRKAVVQDKQPFVRFFIERADIVQLAIVEIDLGRFGGTMCARTRGKEGKQDW